MEMDGTLRAWKQRMEDGCDNELRAAVVMAG